MPEMLSTAHRAMVLGRLAQIEQELADISAWLDQQGCEKPSILIEDAWRDLLAAEQLLTRDPVRANGMVHRRTLQQLPPPEPG